MISMTQKGEQSVHGPITSAISAAIESNVALQVELQRRVEQIKRKKVQNRRHASMVLASMSHELADDDHTPSFAIDENTAGPVSKKRKRGRESIAQNQRASGEAGLQTETSDVHETDASNIFPESARSSKLNCYKNPNRKWMRRFFVDKDGSTPSVLWRSTQGEYEKDLTQSSVVVFERNVESRFKSEEIQDAWKKVRRYNWKNNSFEEVAIKKHKTMPLSVECLMPCFTLADSKIAKTKFTKQECLYMMSMVGPLGGNKERSIDWYELAMKHYAKFKRQTPWRCFSYFRSFLQNPATTRCPPWSPDDDELLLKYLAANGPQYLLQRDSALQTCRSLFPHRSTAQLILRAQSTLVNPNFVHDNWTPDEKRKLALLMRAYSNDSNPINLVSRTVHFPQRAPKSVAEKWIKTLNPKSLEHRNVSQI
jgi:hypothetical protein